MNDKESQQVEYGQNRLLVAESEKWVLSTIFASPAHLYRVRCAFETKLTFGSNGSHNRMGIHTMNKHLTDFDEPHLGAAECDKGRVDETAVDPTMIAQGLRLQRPFMSIRDAAAREAVIRFAIDLAKRKRAELYLVAHS
jgi:hypothetical protein